MMRPGTYTRCSGAYLFPFPSIAPWVSNNSRGIKQGHFPATAVLDLLVQDVMSD